MIAGRKVLAIIPARGGSKGVPKKNIRNLNGKPLIAWTIEEAKKSQYIDKLIVSSDDDEIMKVSREWGAEVPFKRPFELSQDDTPGINPVLHAIKYFPDYEYIVLLQPTSPLRLVVDIDNALEKCIEHNSESTVSVAPTTTTPYWMYKIGKNGYLKSVISDGNYPFQRQQAPILYELNGAVYVSTIESIKRNKSFLLDNTIPYVMPRKRSIDIDTIDDFDYCEFLLKRM